MQLFSLGRLVRARRNKTQPESLKHYDDGQRFNMLAILGICCEAIVVAWRSCESVSLEVVLVSLVKRFKVLDSFLAPWGRTMPAFRLCKSPRAQLGR